MKEQTISNLKKLKSFHNGSYGADINRAIQALEQQPCEDCVSRENALNGLIATDLKGWQLAVALEAIEKLPSVTPQPKRGHWIEILVTNCTAEHKCSECGRILETYHDYGKFDIDDLYEQYPYCHCGAKMEGDTDAEELTK